MSKRTVKIQVGLPIDTHRKFDAYKEMECIKADSEAAVKLIELGLMVVNNKNDDAIGNRELLELILLGVNKTIIFSQVGLNHGFNSHNANKTHEEWLELKKMIKDHAEVTTRKAIKK